MINVQRNHTIDSLKLLCATLVVFIHCEYPYKVNVLPVTEVAVPLFFALSGYFIFGAKRKWERIGRIAKIFAWSAALYLLKTEMVQLLTIHRPWMPTWKNITDLILFNDVTFSIHLWYLPAYIYVLVIVFLIDMYNVWRWAFWSILPLLLTGVFVKYNIADVCPEDTQYFRNAYFNGLPYFLLGACVKITPPLHFGGKCFKKSGLQLLLALVIAGLFLARYYLTGKDLGMLALKEINLMLLTYGIALLAVLTIQTKDNIISTLGRNYSLYIYIFHILIMQVCEVVAMRLPESIENIYMYFNPLVVVLLSIEFTYLLGKLRIIKV